MIANALNGIIDFFCMVVNSLLSVMPDSPFQFDASSWPEWVQTVGVVIPVPGMLAHMTAFVASAGLYIIIRWLLRFVKAVQ